MEQQIATNKKYYDLTSTEQPINGAKYDWRVDWQRISREQNDDLKNKENEIQ